MSLLLDGERSPQAAHYFLVGVFHAAQISSKAVLVQLFVGFLIPQSAGVRRDFVSQHNGPVAQPAKLQLEIHQINADFLHKALQQLVHAESIVLNLLDFFFCGQLQRQGVGIVEQRVPQIVVFIRKLDGRRVEDNALFHAVTLGEGTGGNIADNHLQRHNGHFFYHSVCVGKLLHIVRRHAGLLQPLHQMIGHLVVDYAFARDGSLFFAVEGGGVVLIGDDDLFRIVGGENLFGLSFVKLFSLFHCFHSPWQSKYQACAEAVFY